MIARKLDAFLDNFYGTQKKALLLTGARQVGKTSAFRRFAARTYENYIEINFISTPQAAGIFEGAQGSGIYTTSTTRSKVRLTLFWKRATVLSCLWRSSPARIMLSTWL